MWLSHSTVTRREVRGHRESPLFGPAASASDSYQPLWLRYAAPQSL